uniref:Uncharacterized protein n=1 Tax=Siphoviridae sp. ctqPo10 TaxID=2827948 RepID=A0A8S5SVE5_9CAUD|nr:MAG TPA: hypothetical protein [Siphoviridae sp. ctqPo10]DAN25109.1 MAG TPA: hypothetical protein [Caudoviricetes sp.]
MEIFKRYHENVLPFSLCGRLRAGVNPYPLR